jgi:hypothetical protein
MVPERLGKCGWFLIRTNIIPQVKLPSVLGLILRFYFFGDRGCEIRLTVGVNCFSNGIFVCVLVTAALTPTVRVIAAGITGINIHCSNWLKFMLQLRKFILSHEFNLSDEFFYFTSTL